MEDAENMNMHIERPENRATAGQGGSASRVLLDLLEVVAVRKLPCPQDSPSGHNEGHHSVESCPGGSLEPLVRPVNSTAR